MSAIRPFVFVLAAASAARADDWPQWLGPKRDGVWRETGILDKFPKGGPKVLWRKPVGQGYAGPAVAGGKVFVTDFVADAGRKTPTSAFDKERRQGRPSASCAWTRRPAKNSGSTSTRAGTTSATPPGRAARRPWTATASTPSARWATCSA